MVGGVMAARLTQLFSSRSSILAWATAVQAGALVVVGVTSSFWLALAALIVTSVIMAAAMPVRQTLLNNLIASEQRATVLSFDGLIGSSGGVVIQPALGRTADIWSYGTAYVIGGAVYALSVPFLVVLRTLGLSQDRTQGESE